MYNIKIQDFMTLALVFFGCQVFGTLTDDHSLKGLVQPEESQINNFVGQEILKLFFNRETIPPDVIQVIGCYAHPQSFHEALNQTIASLNQTIASLKNDDNTTKRNKMYKLRNYILCAFYDIRLLDATEQFKEYVNRLNLIIEHLNINGKNIDNTQLLITSNIGFYKPNKTIVLSDTEFNKLSNNMALYPDGNMYHVYKVSDLFDLASADKSWPMPRYLGDYYYADIKSIDLHHLLYLATDWKTDIVSVFLSEYLRAKEELTRAKEELTRAKEELTTIKEDKDTINTQFLESLSTASSDLRGISYNEYFKKFFEASELLTEFGFK